VIVVLGPTRTVDNDEFRDLLRPFMSALFATGLSSITA